MPQPNQPRDRPATSGAKERPILFSGTMVNAILDGRKTMTRGLVDPPIEDHPEAWSAFTVESTCRKEINTWSISKPGANGNIYTSRGRATELWRGKCPYGEPGDRLWVRETWGLFDTQPSDGPDRAHVFYRATDGDRPELRHQLWRPSIFMPRCASRITLEVKGVRLERLQSITAADIIAEGAVLRPHFDDNLGKCPVSAFDLKCYVDLVSLWKAAWDSINGKRAHWASNPWVWVVEFARIK